MNKLKIQYPWLVEQHLTGKHDQKTHSGRGGSSGLIRIPKRKLAKGQPDLSKESGSTLAKTLVGLRGDLKKNPNNKDLQAAFKNVEGEMGHRGKYVRDRIERMPMNKSLWKMRDTMAGTNKKGNYVEYPKGKKAYEKAAGEHEARRAEVKNMLKANLGFGDKGAESAVNQFERMNWVNPSLSFNALYEYDD